MAENLREKVLTGKALTGNEPAAEGLREREPAAEGRLQEDLLQGDFEGFYRHTIASVRQYLSSRVADTHEVEDLVQETYAEALEQWDMLREHPNPCGWLLLTAKHISRRYYRRVYTRTEKLYEDSIAVEDPAYDIVVMEDLLHSLYRRDSEKLARAYFLGGSTITELARDMHLSNKSVSNKLYRIRRRLQDEWK